MKTKFMIAGVFLVSLFACSDDMDSDTMPDLENAKQECIGENCEDGGEDPVFPPCFPNC